MARARHFPRRALKLRPDVPGARTWGVALRQTMLTYFEVAPHSRFPRHHHRGEQITLVLAGTLYFELDRGVTAVRAGEVIAIPSRLAHAVHTKSRPVRAVDAWSPVPTKYRRQRSR